MNRSAKNHVSSCQTDCEDSLKLLSPKYMLTKSTMKRSWFVVRTILGLLSVLCDFCLGNCGCLRLVVVAMGLLSFISGGGNLQRLDAAFEIA